MTHRHAFWQIMNCGYNSEIKYSASVILYIANWEINSSLYMLFEVYILFDRICFLHVQFRHVSILSNDDLPCQATWILGFHWMMKSNICWWCYICALFCPGAAVVLYSIVVHHLFRTTYFFYLNPLCHSSLKLLMIPIISLSMTVFSSIWCHLYV